MLRDGAVVGSFRVFEQNGFRFVTELACNNDPAALKLLTDTALETPRPFHVWVDFDNPLFVKLVGFYEKIGGKKNKLYMEFN